MKKIKVIDNLLPEIYFNKLTQLFTQGHDKTKNSLNWFWNESSVRGDNNFMFTHLLWDTDLGKVSTYFDMFEPILYYIDKYSPVEKIKRMKLNLYTNQNKKIIHGKHMDFTEGECKPMPNITICILNFTSCNGGTLIDKKDHPSKANQGIIFNNDLFHQGYVQTDTPRRIVLNIATNKKHEL